jgi:hypothetical protein
MDDTALALHAGAGLLAQKTFDYLLTTMRAAVASGPAPLSDNEWRAIERAYSVMRELCLYYAALVASRGAVITYPVRHEILTRIRMLYVELAGMRRTKVELSEDPWYDVEENSAPAIRTWIQVHNDTVTNYGNENSPYIVASLPPPQM